MLELVVLDLLSDLFHFSPTAGASLIEGRRRGPDSPSQQRSNPQNAGRELRLSASVHPSDLGIDQDRAPDERKWEPNNESKARHTGQYPQKEIHNEGNGAQGQSGRSSTS